MTNFFPDLPQSLSGWWVLVTFGPHPPESCDPSVPQKQASAAAVYLKLLKDMFGSLSEKMEPAEPKIHSRSSPCSRRLQESGGGGDVDLKGNKIASIRDSLSESLSRLAVDMTKLGESIDKIVSATSNGARQCQRIAAAVQQSEHCRNIYHVRNNALHFRFWFNYYLWLYYNSCFFAMYGRLTDSSPWKKMIACRKTIVNNGLDRRKRN